MPCNSMQSTYVEWTEKTNKEALFKALQEMKLQPTHAGSFIYFSGGSYNGETHQMTLQGRVSEERIRQIKTAYGVQVAKQAFTKAGFVLTEQKQVATIMMRRS